MKMGLLMIVNWNIKRKRSWSCGACRDDSKPLEPVELSVSPHNVSDESTPGGLETIQEHSVSGQEHEVRNMYGTLVQEQVK